MTVGNRQRVLGKDDVYITYAVTKSILNDIVEYNGDKALWRMDLF